MAHINVLPRKEFEIILDDGTVIKGKIGTWAMKRFCLKKNISLGQTDGIVKTLDDVIDYLLCGIEQLFREQKSKESFPYNDVDVCSWIDQLGGMASEEVVKLLSHIGDEEKKTEPEGV